MQGGRRIILLYVSIYGDPRIHVGPIMDFAGKICDACESETRPIRIATFLTPDMDYLYNKRNWEGIRRLVHEGEIRHFSVGQYLEKEKETDWPHKTNPFSFSINVRLIPADGIPAGMPSALFLKEYFKNMSRFPTNVFMWLDLDEFPRGREEIAEETIKKLAGDLVVSSQAAYACLEKGKPHEHYTDPLHPKLSLKRSLIDRLDRFIPDVSWGMFLNGEHIKSLGGKPGVLRSLSGCRVDDLSTGREERLYVQLTENIEDFDSSVADRYRDFFQPLLGEQPSMTLPIRYTDALTQEGLGFTLVLEKPLAERDLKHLEEVINCWYTVGFYGGFGGTGFHDISEPEYDDDDLWVSWVVDMGDVGDEAIEAIGRVLDGLNQPTIADNRPMGLKELVVGHIVE
jgi:hypothetical protein